ncbi:MAG: hypothetical protein QMD99_20165, partial [Rhizobiaceae bacterium]|nr:hypothetical protein [Rhizobiaceae bacterium]
MIEPREFTSAAECIASAAAIRAKFYGRKPPVMVKKPEPKPVVKIATKEPVKHFKKPLWRKVPILF